MKKKTVIAMLMLCMALSATACGEKKYESSAADTQSTDTEEKDSGDTGTSETTETAEADSEETAGKSVPRIVSVSDVSDYVTIGGYKGLTLNRVTAAVSDEDVQSEIDYELSEKGTEVTDGSVENGDTIRISYTGTIDGGILENGSQQDYDMTVGDNMLGEEFDTGVIGMKKGDTREVTVNYSGDYYDTDVAGKTVVYTVTLEKITRTAELNDEWVAANTDYKTVDEYRAGVQKQLEDSASDDADLNLYSAAWSRVLETSEVKEYPSEDLEKAKEAYRNMYNGYLEDAGMTMEEFLEAQDCTEEEFDGECTQYAEEKVKQNLIVQGIIDAEGLSLEDKDTEELKDFLVQSYGVDDIEQVASMYGSDEVNESLALLRVERFIVEQAEVSEMTGSGDDAASTMIANESAYDDTADSGETAADEGAATDTASDESAETAADESGEMSAETGADSGDSPETAADESEN